MHFAPQVVRDDKTGSISTTEPAITCSKLTIEIVERDVKYVQS